MIEIKNLSKSFEGSLILKDVSLTIEKGETVVVIGGSGCGKSTLLRCMNRLVEPDCGSVIFEGNNILAADTDIDKVRQKIGMVYQSFNLFSHLSVLENVILAPMRVRHIPREVAVKEAMEILEKVGMDSRANHMPSALSGGQKQRVAIARCLAMQPDVILFDEPTSALDPTMVEEVESVIRKLVDSGLTSVIVTHEMRFAKSIASRVIFLAERGIYEAGTPEEIFGNPRKSLTKQFMYRSRMYERSFTARECDGYELASEISRFAIKYHLNSKQNTEIGRVIDELVVPVSRSEAYKDMQMEVFFIGDEEGDNHEMQIVYKELAKSPVDAGIIDSMGISILEKTSGGVESKRDEAIGWVVKVKL